MALSQVLTHLYVSDAGLAKTRSVLVALNIKRIVSVTNNPSSLPPAELCAELGIETREFPIEDTSFTDGEGRNTLSFAEGKSILTAKLFPWVRESVDREETVLVHCTMGLSRSPSFIVAYLVWRGMSFEEAWELVKEKHPDASPWLGTMNSFLACVGTSVPAAHIDRYRARSAIGKG